MLTEVTLLRDARFLVDVDRIVGARMGATLASDTGTGIHVHDSIFVLAESRDRTDFYAGGFCALIAAQNREAPAHGRERAALGVLDPGAEIANGNLVLGLACDGAGMAADTPRVVNDESELHGSVV